MRRSDYPPARVSAASEALIPELLTCLRLYVEREGGEEAGVNRLLHVLDELGGGRLAADVMGHEPVSPEPGNALLDRLCNGKVMTRPSPDVIAEQTGLDSALLEKILPLLAMLLCGYISARAGGSGEEDGLHWALDVLVPNKKI
ncbi:MAG: hypothetical protein R3E09_16360 [Novosphingobium sp.]